MFEMTDMQPDLRVQDSEYRRLLGYPMRHVLEGRALELADATRQWYAAHGRPWIYARQIDGVVPQADRLRVNGAELASRKLTEQFADARAHGAVLVVVSAGKACEEQARQLWQEGKPDEYFFMESYGSAVVEHLITAASGRICAWAESNGMAVLPHYSPGYSGWDIADQVRLWDLIRKQRSGEFPESIQVLDTGMLCPKKSLLAVFGITREVDLVRRTRRLVPCENCALPACQFRRAPYLQAPPQIEDARRLQSMPPSLNGDSPASNGSGLDHAADYSLNRRALEKWSRERLQLTFDGEAIEARFRYEGTTCVNLGQPLEFEYCVRLAPAGEAYRILAASCAPAPGDTGHRSMCEYINSGGELMSRIAAETPLVGRPLNDVLDWERPSSPSGCYCDADRRAHKWGLALEVIHYALVQREKLNVQLNWHTSNHST